jgi:hypothetical protein
MTRTKPQFKAGDRVSFRPTDSTRAGLLLVDVVERRLTREEADSEVGPMYHLARHGDAFEDELELFGGQP